MSKTRVVKPRVLMSRLLCGLICLLVLPGGVRGESEVGKLLRRAFDSYIDLRFDEGLRIANGLLQRPDLMPRDSIAIYEFMAVLTHAKGTQYHEAAQAYLKKIADVGPCLNRLPQEFWPRQLRDQWYRIKQARNILVCPSLNSPAARTIAFLPFQNNSIGEYQHQLSTLGHTIAEFLVYHFALFEDLDVVERTQLDYLLREQGLVRDSAVDVTTAVRVGKLLGCHLMVFGSITQFDKKNARLMARVVHVETGKVLTVVIKEGAPKFSKLEKELVKDLAKELKLTMSKAIKKAIKEGGTESMDALQLFNKGLTAMDRYDYQQAYSFFKQAYDLDNGFTEAKQKMDNYKPLVGQI